MRVLSSLVSVVVQGYSTTSTLRAMASEASCARMLVSNAFGPYTMCMQYTIRDVSPAVDAALRRRARASARSLNSVVLDALAKGAGLDGTRPRRRNLDGIAGSGALDDGTLAAFKDQRKIERKLWR